MTEKAVGEHVSAELAEQMTTFNSEMAEASIRGLWEFGPGLLTPEPTTLVQPKLWQWKDIHHLMQRSAELLPADAGAERRAFMFQNPGLPRPGTTQTIAAGFQMFYPGEITPSHRHTAAAIRYVTTGNGAYTTVGGERCTLNWGDFIVTPAWIWHDHGNVGDEAVGWLDGIDVPLVASLNAIFYEPNPQGQQPVTKPGDYSWRKYGAGALRPTWESPVNSNVSLLKWERERTIEALQRLVEVGDMSPFDGAAVEYINPLNGVHCLPTMACGLQLLPPGMHTRAHRHTTSVIYCVHQGTGYTIIDGQRLDWGPGDTFSLPTWKWHEHVNTSETEGAYLFSMTDFPVFEALNLYREEAYTSDHQQVKALQS